MLAVALVAFAARDAAKYEALSAPAGKVRVDRTQDKPRHRTSRGHSEIDARGQKAANAHIAVGDGLIAATTAPARV
jgi:hypothetical protein